ncbi:4-(cytidine 5'-diphospho)-2-C-methyl-D-erythritol kinase [Mycoplasma sp. P36-A1]|uniref:4-(cytidine 5'-diphospho)-2-C-methyl-D-erythritol kinase n=1 Tax=Mycoplasma sp. P36-A1 TaxID=3252900 RepID=UPI003C2BDFAC
MIKHSYAKINIAIDIKNKYADGYHNLDMIMCKVNLFDKLFFSTMKENKIVLTCTNMYIPTDNRNLVYKVIEKVKKVYGIDRGIRVNIAKSIPMQAGLGGGSSNAAATLDALNEMFHLNMNIQDKIDFTKEFGSDIPFFFYNTICRVSGYGDQIQPLECNLSPIHVILIKPSKGVSTKAVYENLKIDDLVHPDIEGLIKALKDDDYDFIIKNIKNSLQESSIQIRPVIKKFIDEINQLGVDVSMVSGSGTTIFAFTKSDEVLKKVKKSHKNKKNFVYVTTLHYERNN